MFKHPTQWLLLLVLMLGLVFVACGGDDDDDSGDDQGTATEEETATASAEATENEATATEDEASDTGDGDSAAAGSLLDEARSRAEGQEITENVRFEMLMEFQGIDASGATATDGIDYSKFKINANGEINADSGRSHVTMALGGIDLAALGGGGGSDTLDFEIIEDGPTTYMRIPFLTQLFGQEQDTWISSPTEGESLASSFTGPFSLDPASQADILAGVGDNYEVVGEEDLRGVKTTHLKVTIDEENASDLGIDPTDPDNQAFIAAGVPFDIWLDEDGRLRKMDMVVPFSQMGEDFTTGFDPSIDTSNATVHLTMELFDYGESVEIALPDPSKVVDENSLMGGLGGAPSATPGN